MNNDRFNERSWKDYFLFSNRERKGLVVLFIILISEIVLLYYFKFIRQPQHLATELISKADSLLANNSLHNPVQRPKLIPQTSNLKLLAESLFYFNPNNLSEEEWSLLGLTERQIRTIKNYENKGGRFYTKDDVMKMHCLSADDYKRLEPYISIPNSYSTSRWSKRKQERAKTSPIEKKRLVVDLATADTTELEKLPLIGKVKARIIYERREKLGGFFSINQLLEIWGINDTIFEVIRPHVQLSDSIALRKINLNKADISDLAQHPYFNKNLSNRIINYRYQHGPFRTIRDLKKNALVNDELYAKIAPYLKVSD